MSYLRPPSVQDYLPEDHLARFVVEIVDQLDLRHLSAVYAGKGSQPDHPAMMWHYYSMAMPPAPFPAENSRKQPTTASLYRASPIFV